MNLLFFYRIFPNYGGVEVVTTILANKFVNDGHQVTIVSIEQPHMELAEQLEKSVKIEKLEYPVISCSNIKKLHSIIINNKIDIIINQWGLPYKTTVLCNRAIKGTSCKLISVLHGSPYISKVIIKAQDKVKSATNVFSRIIYKSILEIKNFIIKWSIRYNCKHNERYILLSKGFIKPLMDYAHINDSSNIIAIGNPVTIPVDLTNFSLENKKKQILYVGRMDYENKRVNRIIEAWELIDKKYPDWELILVGDGPHKKNLIEYVTLNNILNVKFEGFQEEPPINYYKDASIFMLTSDLEGFGLVIIESMSYGVVPIVYGSYEAVYDIIDNGKSGYITSQPYNKEATREKIEFLITHENERKKMAINAMKKAQLFSIDSITNQWYETINKVLSNT
ncbi:glycosyltransferase [uncultured Bacteroides sp.]|uniref:glycosyltransferase n=1 Tax=uncultured Bacteroides sp. TaxID=162156 RepID=UPI00263713B5|nr:glycosyltransferase [uncultured Bacteroides sp.]